MFRVFALVTLGASSFALVLTGLRSVRYVLVFGPLAGDDCIKGECGDWVPLAGVLAGESIEPSRLLFLEPDRGVTFALR